MVMPYCEGQYIVAVKNGCYEGCVRKNECTIPACPQTPPANKASCGPVDYPCFYEDCGGAGRTLATCASGVWTVQTTACTAVTCQGANVTPAAITCPVGQVCVRTASGNVSAKLTPKCVDNTCGKGPISPQCISGLSGNCATEIAASMGEIYCTIPLDCGPAMGGCSTM
jgi:hypothetical protein